MDGVAAAAALGTGSILLVLGAMLRGAATALTNGTVEDPPSSILRRTSLAAGLAAALLGMTGLGAGLCTLIIGSDQFHDSLMFFPAGVTLGGALIVCLVFVAGDVAPSRTATHRAAVDADALIRETARWRFTTRVLVGTTAILAIAGALFGILEFDLPSGTAAPAGLVLLGAGCSLLVLTGLCLLRAGRMMHIVAGGETARDALAAALRKLSWVHFLLGAAALLVPSLFVESFVGWAMLGGVFAVVLALMIVGAMLANARAQGLSAFWTVSTTLNSGRTLADELTAQSRATTGAPRRRLERAASQIAQGAPLSELLYRSGIVPRSCWLQAAGGLASGRLPDALREAAARETARFSHVSTTSNTRYMFGYLGLVCCILCVLVGFLLIFIVPKFKRIFQDFGMELPNATQLLLSVSDVVVAYWYLSAPLMLIPISAIVAELLAMQHGWSEIFERAFGPRLVRLRAPDLLRGLKWAVEAGRPLDEVLQQMAQVPLPTAYRTRLYHAAKRIERGEDAWEVLHRQGWISGPEAELLKTAQQNQHLGWALETLSEAAQSSREFRLAALIEVLSPVVLLIVALVVAAIVYCFFLPLVFLIMNLS